MDDIAVVGAGIVGLATALRLRARAPRLRLHVLDKEPRAANHQTGRNSGVLHAGVYYDPKSAKARFCREGLAAMERFCDAHGVPRERCGKVIVATEARELPALERLEARGRANGVTLHRVGPERLRELEPRARAVAALHVEDTGIVDYRRVAEAMRRALEADGVTFSFGARLIEARDEGTHWHLETTARAIEARAVVACAGLYSDRVARLFGLDPGLAIVPFRGEYFRLIGEAADCCKGLIYPVPDARFPFLGVHVTRRIDGTVDAGPNAVLAFAREGYTWADVHPRELAEALAFPGTRRLLARHWRMGAGEAWRSLRRRAFARSVARLVPGVGAEHLEAAPAGVRAQALRPDGTLVDDFAIVEGRRCVHVCNAPSPAATASLAIGDHVAARALERMQT